jgi:AraC-like DNA-binding protein
MALSYLTAADERISRAERWARARLHQGFSISDLAEAAGLGLRTFARRCERVTGLSPMKLVQRLRVERALELLETTRLTLEEISEQVGYAEPSTLRKLLHREAALSARTSRAGRRRKETTAPPTTAGITPPHDGLLVRSRGASPTMTDATPATWERQDRDNPIHSRASRTARRPA